MREPSDRLRSPSTSQIGSTTSILTSRGHSSTSTYNHSYSYPPLNTPLLVVSPTSPVATPSKLPVVVSRPETKQSAPVIHCTSWLHPKELSKQSLNNSNNNNNNSGDNSIRKFPSRRNIDPQNTSQDILSSSCGLHRNSLQILSPSYHLGFRGSKIPVRSARGSNRGLFVEGPDRRSRSRSLSNLSIEDFSPSSHRRTPQTPTQTPTPRSSLKGSQSPTTPLRRNFNQKSKIQSLPQPSSVSPSRPLFLRRESSSITSYSSSGSLQCPPSPPTGHRTSPRVVRRSCEDPLKTSHDPYETSQYFTFHLTLRNPVKSPARSPSTAIIRNSQSYTYGNRHTEASQAATRCVEDMILQTCAVPSPEMLQTVRLPHSIHMPQVPSCDISIEGSYKGDTEEDLDATTHDSFHHNQETEEEKEETKEDAEQVPKLRQITKEDPINRDNSNTNIIRSHSIESATVESPIDLDLTGANIHCISFGIVDCLNTVMKDSEHDETESNCSDCGSGLAVTPPTRLSDTDSTIEPLPVSLDLPLKGFPSSKALNPSKKKIDMRNLKWRSCQELLSKQTKRRMMLHRQLSEKSLKAHLLENNNLHNNNNNGSSVEVYDGNLGLSIITITRSKRNSSTGTKRSNRQSASATDGHTANSSPMASRESSRTGRHLVHQESCESTEYGCHDSLAVEPSDTEYGEQMDIDDSYALPSSFASAPCHAQANSYMHGQDNHNSLKEKLGKIEPKVQANIKTKNPTILGDKAGKLPLELENLADPEVDRALDILEDDGMGPGLSEDEMNAVESPPTNCHFTSTRGVGMISPHKILWYLQKESRRRSGEMAMRRGQPLLPDHGRIPMGVYPEYRIRYSGHDASQNNLSVSDTSQPTSAVSHQVRVYSDVSQGDSSGEDSDTGAELSELERCVLSLNHRRSQLRKQDTNAFLIAPPEYKIGEDVSTVPEDSQS